MEETKEFQERVSRIEGLLQAVESSGDPSLRRSVRQLVESLMELHGTALERILEFISNAGAVSNGLIGALGADPLISSLLVLYGLHPDDFETRVRSGLENARAALQREGAHWEELQIQGNTVRVRIIGSQDAAETRRLEAVVREALLTTAPDASDVQIASGAIGGGGGVTSTAGFVPLARLRSADGSPIAAAAAPHLVKT